MELSSLDYHYLVQEWQALIGGRIQKIYIKDRLLVLQIYTKQNYQWVFTDGTSFLSSAKIAFPQSPPGFCMFLRKRVQGFRIKNIELLGFDRIIKITIETKTGPLELIVEILGKINAVLVKDGKIVSAWETRTFSERTIKSAYSYIPPPSRPAPWDADLASLEGKDAAKALAVELGLGGRYAEEICSRAGIERKEQLTKTHLTAIKKELEKLKIAPLHPVHNEKEALPYPFKSKQGDWKTAETFNAAVDAIAGGSIENAEAIVQEQGEQQLVSKQERIKQAQELRIQEMEAAIIKNQEAGEKIYEHYSELKILLEQLQSEWKELGFKELQDKYKSHAIVKALRKDGTVELEL